MKKAGLDVGQVRCLNQSAWACTDQMTTAVPLTATMSMEPLSPMVS